MTFDLQKSQTMTKNNMLSSTYVTTGKPLFMLSCLASSLLVPGWKIYHLLHGRNADLYPLEPSMAIHPRLAL